MKPVVHLMPVVAKRKQPAGLGDTIEAALKPCGGDWFKRTWKKVTGRPCGCAKRKALLNKLFPYN